MQYRDQLEEINLLTGRIHALSDALEAKGFYPAGGAEIADAVQTAIRIKTPGDRDGADQQLGGVRRIKGSHHLAADRHDLADHHRAGDACKQIIEDIYQITGLADIMRGATDPQETLGAQQLKTQYGSTRIRDKQQELVRLARDLVEITSEIIIEKFDTATIIEMSQIQLPTQADEAAADDADPAGPDAGAAAAAGTGAARLSQASRRSQTRKPSRCRQWCSRAWSQLRTLQEKPTIEQVLYFLKDNRAKSFVLDIETDSTIMQDENAEKQRRTEFVQVLGPLLPQLSQLITAEPKTANVAGEILKFATAPFRAGRSLEGSIDELVEMMKEKGGQQKGDDPATAAGKVQLQIEQMKQQTAKEKNAQDAAIKQAELQQKDHHKQLELQNERAIKTAELQAKMQDGAGKIAVQNQKAMTDREAHQAHMIENEQKMALDRQKAQVAMKRAGSQAAGHAGGAGVQAAAGRRSSSNRGRSDATDGRHRSLGRLRRAA